MPNTIDVVKTLTVQGRSIGMDKVAADLKAVASGQEHVATSGAKLVSATASVERGTLSAQRQLDNLTKSMDPLTNAMAKLERIQRAAGSVQAQGGIVSEANTRAISNARARVDELREAVEKHSASVGLNRMQQLEAVHVAKSFVDQVIAGQSPLRALAVEGGRIGQIFASGSGGVGGTLKAVGSSLGGLAAGWTGLGAAAVAASGLAYTAAMSFVEGQDKMAASLEGTGRAAGLTFGQLSAIAAGGAAASGRLSISDAQSAAGTFAHAGVGGTVNQGLVASVPDYARVSGTGLDEAAKTLAQAFADPEKGAATLNQQLGFLNDRVMTQIHTYEASGNIEAARTTLLSAYNASLADITDRTWTLSRAFESVKVDASNAFERLGKDVAGLFGHRDPADQLQSLQRQQGLLPANDTFNRQRLQAQIDALTQQMGQRDTQDRARADQAKRDADANTLALQAREVIRSILPEIERNETFATRSGILQRAVANPTGLDNPADASRALGMLTTQHAFSDPFTVMRQDAQLALDAVNATTLAERAAVEARRAELAVLRETGDVSRAASAAQGALNLEITKANAAADQALDKSRQNAAMVGLTPLERQVAEIHNRYQDMRDKSVFTGKEMTTSLAPVDADLRSAGQLIVDALRDVAGTIRGANPYGTLGGVKIGGDPAAAIRSIESSGNYGALGPLTKGGDRAYGAYQVMGANIPSWSRAALGYSLTPSQFLADKSAQDAVFSHQFGMSMARYGNASDAASVWFTGRPLAQGANARDITGTSGSQYVDRFNAALGGAPASVRPTVALTARASIDKAEANDRSTAINGGLTDRLTDMNRDLDTRNKLLAIERSTMGQSAAEIEAAAAAQQKLNEFSAQGFDKYGPEVWRRVTDGVKSYHDGLLQTLTAEQRLHEQQQKTIGTMDGIRDASKGALSTFVTDLRNGQGAGKALQDVMSGLTDKLLNLAEDQAIKGLFGASGTAQGGLMSGLLSAFGIGGSTAGAAGAPLNITPAVHHAGGIVGVGGAPTRLTPLAAFAGAPRYHSGYGLAADERAAILQTGEAVISRADLAAARAQKSQAQAASAAPVGQGGGPTEIHMHNAPAGSTVADVKTTRGPDGKQAMHVMFQTAALHDVQTNGPMTQALQKRFGAGRVG